MTEQTQEIKKPKWGALASLVVSFSSYVLSQYILVAFLLVLGVFLGKNVVESNLDTPWVSLALAAVSSILMIGFVWLFLKRRNVKIKELGFIKPTSKGIGLMLVSYGFYFVLLVVTMVVVTALIPSFDENQVQEIGYENVVGWQLVLAFIGLVIIPPVTEEIFFRGFLYKGLANSWPKWIAAIVASLLFALAHMQWNVGIDVFLMSLVLIYLYEKTGNLWLCVGLHALKNLIAFLALFVFVH